MTVKVGDEFYRYNSKAINEPTWFDAEKEKRPNIWLEVLRVTKVTPKGVWLDGDQGWRGKFVLLGSGKRYAYPDKSAAKESFIIRQQRRLKYLARDLEIVKSALAFAERDIWPETGGDMFALDNYTEVDSVP